MHVGERHRDVGAGVDVGDRVDRSGHQVGTSIHPIADAVGQPVIRRAVPSQHNECRVGGIGREGSDRSDQQQNRKQILHAKSVRCYRVPCQNQSRLVDDALAGWGGIGATAKGYVASCDARSYEPS